MSQTVPLEGLEVAIHASLTQPILLGGAPRGLAIMTGTAAAAIGLGLQQIIAGMVLWAVGHSLCVAAARRDTDFLPVLLRHLRQRSYWAC
jgi:type IV secretion system protein VirB3